MSDETGRVDVAAEAAEKATKKRKPRANALPWWRVTRPAVRVVSPLGFNAGGWFPELNGVRPAEYECRFCGHVPADASTAACPGCGAETVEVVE